MVALGDLKMTRY